MKKLLLILAVSGCAHVQLHPANLTNFDIERIVVGTSMDELRLQTRIYPASFVNLEDGSRMEIYTADYRSDDYFYCRNVILTFDSQRIVSKIKIQVTEQDQMRCENYAAVERNLRIQNNAAINSVDWESVGYNAGYLMSQ